MQKNCRAILAAIVTLAFSHMCPIGRVEAYSVLNISDPVTYAKFRSGEIGENIDIVNIQPNAHPTLLHEPPHFANNTNFKITFTDGLSRITLFPRNRAVLLTHNQNVSFAIPNHYEEYEYEIRPSSILSDDDIDFLATCKQATSFGFIDAGDVTIRFIHRIVAWNKNLRKLKFLRMSVSKEFLWGTSFRPYLGFLTALQAAAFEFHDVSSKQIEKFVRKQGIAGGWIRHGSNANVVAYFREGQNPSHSINPSHKKLSSAAKDKSLPFSTRRSETPRFSSSNQITIIETPQMYEAFKRREYAANAQFVQIEAGAHPNLLTEVKHFWNATNQLIRFNDIDYHFNYVTLEPNNGKIVADFHKGFNLTLGLPDNYVNYTLTFGTNAIVTSYDITFMLGWTNSRYLDISDECNVAVNFLQRIHVLKALENLENLKLDIHAYAMTDIILRPFFDSLVKLKRVDFSFKNVSWLVRERFVARQEIPREFKRVKSLPGTVSYVKK